MVFDGFFAIILLWAVIRGFKRGLARQVLLLTALTIACFSANWIGGKTTFLTTRLLKDFPEESRLSINVVGAAFIMFTLVLLVGSSYLNWYRKKVMGTDGPSFGDRLFGGLFGLAIGCFWVSVVASIYDQLPTALTQIPIVRSQSEESRGLKINREYKVVDKLTGLPEVQQLRDHAVRILYDIRSDADTSNGSTPASTPSQKSALPLP